MIYEITCKACYKTYVGETGRGVDVRLKERRSDVKFHRTSNAIVQHIEECHHLPDWNETNLLEKKVKKRTIKVLEAAHILTRNTFNSWDGFITWSSAAAKLADRLIKHIIFTYRILHGFCNGSLVNCIIPVFTSTVINDP